MAGYSDFSTQSSVMLDPNSSTNLGGGGYYIAPINNQPAKYNPPGVLGVNTGGGGGGSNPAPNNNQAAQAPAPQAPPPINPFFDQAMGLLSGLEAGPQATYESQRADIAAQNTKAAGNINTAAQEQQNVVAGSTQTQQTQAENAKAEARRGYSETRQGLQARYGGTTGTGAFASDIAYAATQHNIGQIEQNLANNLDRLQTASLHIKQLADQHLQDLEAQTNARMQQAKASLQDQLSQIRLARGELEVHKSDLAYQAISRYQDAVRQVNEFNVNAKNQLAQTELYIQSLVSRGRQSYIDQANQGQGGLGNLNQNLTSTNQNVPSDTQANIFYDPSNPRFRRQ